ncbi:uncharacterized protein LOC127875157 [Dreissena polymorpha]|uniref:Uncharacterized protein n=1 Tax=Dreissena polymorpha TaxID=45954 RepID=A0A9D4L9T7_DREPO|nr:uncharacterized protein LOC127875157 [Dreissena polymorpha]KAH3853152.1 hypothetical protein DPMN_095674 [Dreissena polymorpha]
MHVPTKCSCTDFSKAHCIQRFEEKYGLRHSMEEDVRPGAGVADDKGVTGDENPYLDEFDLIERARLTKCAMDYIKHPKPRLKVEENRCVNELEAILMASLTTSAKEEVRLSVEVERDDSDDMLHESNEKITGDEFAFPESENNSPRCMDALEVEEKRDMMYSQRPLDEDALIQNAKLADDGLSEIKHEHAPSVTMNPKMSLVLNEQKWNWLNLPGEADGFRTPANSEDGLCSVRIPHSTEKIVQTIQPEVTDVEADDMAKDADFKSLMAEIALKLEDCYLDDIISVFHGTWILEEGCIAGASTTDEILRRLQQQRFISRDNLHHLQTIVMRLDDTDLYTQAVQYIRHHHDTVYFYKELATLPKGFGLVRCHLSERDFTRLSREDLELVRFKLASVLFLSPKDAYIVGIEPGRRVVISCSLPVRYVQELAEMARDGLSELRLAEIEFVEILGKMYDVQGNSRQRNGGPWDHNRHAPFLSVYQQLRDKSKLLQEKDQEVKDLREETQFMQLELDTMSSELQLLTERALHESSKPYESARRHWKRTHGRSITFPLSIEAKMRHTHHIQPLEEALLRAQLLRNPEPDPFARAMVPYRPLKSTGPRSILPAAMKFRTETDDEKKRAVLPVTAGDELPVKHIVEANVIMNEIQEILDEILFLQAFVK